MGWLPRLHPKEAVTSLLHGACCVLPTAGLLRVLRPDADHETAGTLVGEDVQERNVQTCALTTPIYCAKKAKIIGYLVRTTGAKPGTKLFEAVVLVVRFLFSQPIQCVVFCFCVAKLIGKTTQQAINGVPLFVPRVLVHFWRVFPAAAVILPRLPKSVSMQTKKWIMFFVALKVVGLLALPPPPHPPAHVSSEARAVHALSPSLSVHVHSYADLSTEWPQVSTDVKVMMKNGMAFPPGHPAHPHFKRGIKAD